MELMDKNTKAAMIFMLVGFAVLGAWGLSLEPSKPEIAKRAQALSESQAQNDCLRILKASVRFKDTLKYSPIPQTVTKADALLTVRGSANWLTEPYATYEWHNYECTFGYDNGKPVDAIKILD